jgi:inner membrane protein
MPLPIGHALAGIAIFQSRSGLFFKNKLADALFFIFLANLPDADFLPGLFLGFPNLYHHGISHSLGAALAVALALGWIFSRKQGHFRMLSIFAFFSFCSHLLLDFFSKDFTVPYGLPLLWPFSNSYYIAAHPVFLNITRSDRSSSFFFSLLNRHNLDAALREIVLLGGLVILAGIAGWLFNKRTGRSKSG